MDSVFKACSCGAVWKTRDDFLSDLQIKLAGYQAHFEELQLGLFLFNHTRCGTTLALEAKQFLDMYSGPIYQDRATGTAQCPGYCLHRGNLDLCPATCECAHIRELLHIIIQRQAAE